MTSFSLAIVLLLYLSISPPYYDIVINYRNPLECGKKAQRNHEACTTWAFPIKLQKITKVFLQLTKQLVVPSQRLAESRQDFVSSPHIRDIVIIASFTFNYHIYLFIRNFIVSRLGVILLEIKPPSSLSYPL